MTKLANASKKDIRKTIAYIFILSFLSLFILIPFYIVFITSIKANNAIAIHSPFIWFPSFDQLSFRAYDNLFTWYKVNKTGMSLIVTGIINTIIILIPCLTIGLFCSALSAFAFAKLKFPCKKLLFTLLIGSMMLPGVILMVPSYLIFDSLYLTNTFFPVMVPGMFGSAAAVFFLKQFYSKIPDSLIEAAKIDGLGFWGIFFKIMIPLSLPGLICQGVFGFLAILNDYMGPLIYLQTEDKYTLQVALQMFSGGNNQDLPTVMAACFFAMVPSFIIYLIAQKYFIEGIAFTGMKE